MSTFTMLCTFLLHTFLYPLLHPSDIEKVTSQLRAVAGVQVDISMGTITVDGSRPYVFVKAGDGSLWVNWWDGSAWHWSDQGLPPGVSIVGKMGAITVDAGR